MAPKTNKRILESKLEMKVFQLKPVIAVLFFTMMQFVMSAQGQSLPRDETLVRHGHMPISLDPAYATSHGEYQVLQDLFEGLVTTDEHGAIIPGLAERWTISENGLEYVFYLKEGLVWSDGTKLIAQDFVTAFQRVVQPSKDANAKAHYLFPIIKNAEDIIAGKLPVNSLGVSAIDEKTLKINLEAPASYLISLLLNPAFYPVPTHIIEQHGKSWHEYPNLVSNGAYSLKSPVQENAIKFVKNAKYHDPDSIYFNYLVHRNLTESDESLALLARGEADIVHDFYGDQIKWLVENNRGHLITFPDKATLYLSLNLNNEFLKDINVRKAMSIVLNREVIAQRIKEDEGEERRAVYSYSTDSQSLGWKRYVPGWVKSKTLNDRIAQAKKLMRAAGYGPDNKLKLKLIYARGASNRRLINALNVEYSQIWIELQSESMDLRDLFSTMRKGDFEIGLSTWLADFDDPINFLQNLRPGAPYNYSSWNSQAYESLAEKLVVTIKPEGRRSLIEGMEKLIDQQVPVIPLTESLTKILVRNGISSPKPNYFGLLPARLQRFKPKY